MSGGNKPVWFSLGGVVIGQLLVILAMAVGVWHPWRADWISWPGSDGRTVEPRQ